LWIANIRERERERKRDRERERKREKEREKERDKETERKKREKERKWPQDHLWFKSLTLIEGAIVAMMLFDDFDNVLGEFSYFLEGYQQWFRHVPGLVTCLQGHIT